MRFQLTVFLVSLFVSFTATAQTPAWPTIIKEGEAGYGYATRHEMDAVGNHFIAGAFFDSLRIGNTLLTGSSDFNGFIAKYSPNWTLQWVHQQQDTSTDIINGLAVDAAGNCYVSGIFTYLTTFAGTALVATPDTFSFAPADGMVAKLSPTGSLIWLRHISGEGKGGPLDLTLDSYGNLYVAGFFENEISAGPFTLSGSGPDISEAFLLKMDLTGNVVWAEKTSNSDGAGYSKVTTDTNGNIIVTGSFYDGVTVGGQTLLNTSPVQPALNLLTVKYSPAGVVLWVRNAAGNIENDEISANTVKTDASGNVYMVGSYGPQALNFGFVVLPAVGAQGYSNAFLAKYNSNGVLQWAKALTSTGFAGASALAVDATGNSFIGGSFEDNISFGSQALTPAATGDLFFAKYSSAGVFQWVQQGNSTEEAGILDILLTASQDIYLTGGFIGSMQLPGGPQISTTNDIAIFYASTIPFLATPLLLSAEKDIQLFPNPAKEKVTLTFPDNIFLGETQLQLFTLTGQQVFNSVLTINSGKSQLKLPELTSGVYLLEVQNKSGIFRKRIEIK